MLSRLFAFIFIGAFFYSCSDVPKDGFYSDWKYEDLYRIPLLQPYELTMLSGFTEVEKPTWELKFKNNGDQEFPLYYSTKFEPGIRVKEINVINGVVFGNCINSQKDDIRIIVIPAEGYEKVYINKRKAWDSILANRNIPNPQMFRVWNVFNDFKKTGKLPWKG